VVAVAGCSVAVVVGAGGGATAAGPVAAGSSGESTGTTPPSTSSRKTSSTALRDAIAQKRMLESDCLLNPDTDPLFALLRPVP
jgi:hypothetical protein